MANVYAGSVEWTAVAAWATLHAYVSTSNGGRGDYVRQLAAPSVGNERVFRCTTSGTSLAAEPTWTLTHNQTTTEVAGPVWTECTGQEADQVSGTWRAPHAREANALVAGWCSAGDTVYLSHDHAETQGTAITLQSPATQASPCRVICVNAAGTVPPVSTDLRTTATITATSDTNIFIGSGTECIYYYGVNFSVGAARIDIGSGTLIEAVFDNCLFTQTGTGRSVFVQIGNGVDGGYVLWENTGLNIAGVDCPVRTMQARFYWTSTVIPLANTAPTLALIRVDVCSAYLEGVDLSSALFNGANLVFFSTGAQDFTVKNCKYNAGLLTSNLPDAARGAFYNVVSDSSGTNYRGEKKAYAGSQVVETTIVRTGGATDGTTPISWKIVTTANCNGSFPYESLPMAIWNEVTGTNRTVTLYGIWGGGAVPNNDDIWIEVSYMGSASSPIATINTANTLADPLAAATPQASDSSTWGGSTTAFKMAVTLSSPQPAMKGPIYAIAKCAKPSTTFYLDPPHGNNNLS